MNYELTPNPLALTVLKLTLTTLLFIFIYYGFDMKKQKDWKVMAEKKWTLLMKGMSVSLAVVLTTSIVLAQQILVTDLMTLLCMALGAFVVRSAKKELEKYSAFTWTGYVLPKPALVTSGIYAFVRHPLYCGVYLTVIGGCCFFIPRLNLWFSEYSPVLIPMTIAGAIYALTFNAILAGRESSYLRTQFGSDYDQYAQKVSAFWPFPK